MTTYLGKSCSFCLPRVPFVNCRQFMYLVISLLVLRAGYGIWLYQFLIIAYLFTLHWTSAQSDQSLRCPHEESLEYQADISLRRIIQRKSNKRNWKEGTYTTLTVPGIHETLKFVKIIFFSKYWGREFYNVWLHWNGRSSVRCCSYLWELDILDIPARIMVIIKNINHFNN